MCYCILHGFRHHPLQQPGPVTIVPEILQLMFGKLAMLPLFTENKNNASQHNTGLNLCVLKGR